MKWILSVFLNQTIYDNFSSITLYHNYRASEKEQWVDRNEKKCMELDTKLLKILSNAKTLTFRGNYKWYKRYKNFDVVYMNKHKSMFIRINGKWKRNQDLQKELKK